MKKHLSTIVFGCLGLCAGFTLCFVFVTLPEREANLPLSFPPQTIEQAHVTVTIAQDGGIYFGNKHVELARLTSFLQEHAANGIPLVIRARKDAGYSSIVRIVEACRTAGVKNVAFGTNTVE